MEPIEISDATSPRCTNFAPQGFTGHWRDWHRGHGCNLDHETPAPRQAEMEPRSPTGQARAHVSVYLTATEHAALKAAAAALDRSVNWLIRYAVNRELKCRTADPGAM